MGTTVSTIKDWPGQLERINALRDRCLSLSQELQAGTEFDENNVFGMIREIEDDAGGLDLRSIMGLPDDAGEIRTGLMTAILRLKGHFFDRQQQANNNPHLTTSCAEVCDFCHWALKALEVKDHDSGVVVKVRRYLCAVDHWPDFPELEKRSRLGCKMCQLLRESLLLKVWAPSSTVARFHVWLEFTGDQQYGRWFHLEKSQVYLIPPSGYPHDMRPVLALKIEALKGTLDMAARLGSHFPEKAPLSPANVDFIKKQLASTESGLSHTQYRPRRLLDLGPNPNSPPRLIETQDGDGAVNNLKYAALSYCWGPPEDARQQLKLTHASREKYYHAVPTDEMTSVLKDAVTVCRTLGIRYLWIDALCIFQDDQTDWEEQSYQMSRIFGESWLTICAAASSSCMQGFLEHPDRRSSAVQVTFNPQDSPATAVSLLMYQVLVDGVPTADPRLIDVSPFELDINSAKWNTRGWVFQEKSLAQRRLLFGARMVHFQHGNTITIEKGVTYTYDFFEDAIAGVKSHIFTGDFLKEKLSYSHLGLEALDVGTIKGRTPFVPDLWYNTVSGFITSGFTEKFDTLPAISGIARRFGEITRHRYLAGLWEEDLHCGLLWKTNDDFYLLYSPKDSLRPGHKPASLRQALRVLKRSELQLGPSWSWVSKQWRQRFGTFLIMRSERYTACRERTHLRPDFTLLGSKIEVDGSNPLGRIKSASISLFGRTLKRPSRDRGWNQTEEWVWTFRQWSNALIYPDWSPRNGTEGAGRTSQAQLRLLLISSCCSAGQYELTRCAGCIGQLRAGTAPPHTTSCHDCTAIRVGGRAWNESLGKLRTEPDGFFDDSSTPFSAATDCERCSDPGLIRDVWGLLIYPAGPPNTYHRVGVFVSMVEDGGSDIFEDAEECNITLI